MTQTAIVGWGHLPFGRIQEDVEQMIVGAAGAALDDAGLGPEDVDAIFLLSLIHISEPTRPY